MPDLQKEREWICSDEARERKRRISEEYSIPVDDIFWVDKNADEGWAVIAYRSQRQVLEYVCEEVQKELPDRFSTVADVFKEFLKAHFTGRLLPIARLIEKTFGEGSFRLLGNMGVEQESGVLHLASLEKARSRVVRTHNKKAV